MGQKTRNFIFLTLTIAILWCTAGQVNAQGLTDGIRFGVFSIHPSLYTAMRYNDNVYFVPDNYRPENISSVPQGIESDFVFNVVPAIIFNVGLPSFIARAGYEFYNDTYLGYDDPDNRHDELDASNHTFTGLLDYNAPFGLMIGASDSYSMLQTYQETEQFVDFQPGDQTHNDARGWLGFRHGSYDNVYIRFLYQNLIDRYREYQEYDSMAHNGLGELRLKFFPRTAVVAQGGYGISDHDYIQAFDSTNWWAMAGLQGQITNHLMAVFKGGWAQADYQENDDFSGWLAEAELTAIFIDQSQLTGGYRHVFHDAADTNYYTTHEGYLRYTRLWGSRLISEVYGSYQMNAFSEPLARDEDFMQGSIDLTYRFIHWLFFGGGYRLEYLIYDDGEVRETTTRNIGIVHIQAQF